LKVVISMPTLRLPEEGILWQGWSDVTLKAIDEKGRPVLLFVADPDPLVWPFLREIFKEMPTNARLRALLHDFYPALYIEANALPNLLRELGAGNRYHIAILSPHGLTPMITIDVVSGKPAGVVDEIVAVLERLLDVWCS
jgi:hypothetical protein